MADQLPSFEHALEADMQRLALEIKNNRERPESRNAGERELIKEAIRAFPAPTPQQAAASAAGPAPQQDDPRSPLPAYATGASPEVKLEIEYLLDVALRAGIGKAVDEAKRSPYFVQDAFHDALAGRLYPELQKRGIVQ